jgi:hypothetical protein
VGLLGNYILQICNLHICGGKITAAQPKVVFSFNSFVFKIPGVHGCWFIIFLRRVCQEDKAGIFID